ncbi:hypothetical protein ACE2AJ_09520 [Aquihabitans daechungensis]|uniref:hypothetical protein n=1 Tax=Aquihabitans daechungensis TaxID=1052257 RepID=UPI003B9F55B7
MSDGAHADGPTGPSALESYPVIPIVLPTVREPMPLPGMLSPNSMSVLSVSRKNCIVAMANPVLPSEMPLAMTGGG